MNLKNKTKDNLVSILTRFDTSCYRINGLLETGIIKHEPPKFALRLMEIYNKLDKEDIIELIKIRCKNV